MIAHYEIPIFQCLLTVLFKEKQIIIISQDVIVCSQQKPMNLETALHHETSEAKIHTKIVNLTNFVCKTKKSLGKIFVKNAI